MTHDPPYLKTEEQSIMKKQIIFLILLICPTLSYACPVAQAGHNLDYDINAVFCNKGGYAISKMWFYLYNQEGEEVLEDSLTEDFLHAGGIRSFRFNVPFPDENNNGIDDNGWYKMRIKYKIWRGEKHSCIAYFKRKKHRPELDIQWYVYSEGTTTMGNKCNTKRFKVIHSKVY